MGYVNAWWLYLIVGVVFAYVLLQSTVFLIKARQKALALDFTKEQINKTIIASAVFSIAPSLAILIGLITLARVFGPMLAGMRLATLGAVTYELPAAINVITAFGQQIGDLLAIDVIITALWVMTLGCIPPLLIIPLFFKRMSMGLDKIKEKDSTWKNIMMDALFLGMISAFVGYVLARKPIRDVDGVVIDTYFSWLSVLVLLTSAALIVVFGIIIKKYKQEWLRNYALPLSMVIAMSLAILFASMGVR